MSRLLVLISLTAILLSGCAPVATTLAKPPTAAQPTLTAVTPPTVVPTATPAAQAAGDCPVTPAIKDEPPKDPNASPFGLANWYINADRTLWAGAPAEGQSWRAGGYKMVWIRPAGADLVITGHRLDAEAPPLHADIPCCYPTGFQVTSLIFPTEGCWDVTAKSRNSVLRFVTLVAPGEHPAAGGACASLADAVKLSDAIVVGRVTAIEMDGRYAWDTVAVLETWKLPSGWSGLGDSFSLLQDLHSEPKLENNRKYVLFQQYGPWQLVCPQQTVIEVRDTQAIPVAKDSVWPGGTQADLKRAVDQLAAPH